MSTRQENAWKRFYRAEHLSAESCDAMWRERVRRSVSKQCVCLFALAWYEARSSEPLNLQLAIDVARQHFGFEYHNEFNAAAAQGLQRQLAYHGVTLLHAGNGFQYLRTIHRLSGAIYLRVAQVIRDNRISMQCWFQDDGELSAAISDVVNIYSQQGDDPTDDVKGFLRRMKKRYEMYYRCPTVEQCCYEEKTLSRSMVGKILERLWGGNRGKGGNAINEEIVDTGPHLALGGHARDGQNRLVVCFRPENPVFHISGAATTVCFEFKNGDKLEKVVRFRRVGAVDQWMMDADQAAVAGISIEKFTSIQRSVWNGQQQIGEKVEVTPGFLRDPSIDHVLLKLTPPADNGTRRLLRVCEPGENVPSGSWFTVIGINGESPAAYLLDEEENEFAIKLGQPFQVSVDNIALRVTDADTDTVYPIKTCASEWVDVDSCRWTGARLFCEQGQNPFTDDFADNREVRAFYRKSTGGEIELSDSDEIPSNILWDRGWIVFKDCRGEEKAKRALTFVPDIDESAIMGQFDLNAEVSATVRFGGEEIMVMAPPYRTTARPVQNNVHGFSNFSFKLNRNGTYLRVGGSDTIIPLSGDVNNRTEIASEDFAMAVLRIVDDEDKVIFASGAKDNVEMPLGTITGLALLERAGAPEDGDWEVRAGGVSAFFHVYEPEKTPIGAESNHPVTWWCQGEDLVVRFWGAHVWKNKQLQFVFYPAHRQDKDPVIWKDVQVSFDSVDGRAQVLLLVRGLHDDSRFADWGCGILSFVGYDKGDGSYRAVSSGFFVVAEESENFICSMDDDPYGLRIAMARCDIDRIEQIMQTSDPDARDWIRQFEHDTLHALNKIGALEYFHAYRSNCIDADGSEMISGYFFMAGWLLREKMEAEIEPGDIIQRTMRLFENVRKGVLPEDYKGRWSSLLMADCFFSNEELDVMGNLARSILEKRAEMTGNGNSYQRYWTSCRAFNDPGAENLVRRMDGLMSAVADSFLCNEFDPSRDDVSFVDFGGHFDGVNRLATDLEDCLSRLAKWVSEWRRVPTLKGAQQLRNFLLEVQDIDIQLSRTLKDTEGDHGERLIWYPIHSMLERIALKADVFRVL